MGTERVVALLRSHRVRIARALVRQSRTLSVRYQQLDETAQEHGFLSLLFAVEQLLEKGDESSLRDQTEHLATMRASMGFPFEDFLLVTMGWLPVMRRFIVEDAVDKQRDIMASLDDYDAFEALALPMIVRAASDFLQAGEDPTVPTVSKDAVAKATAAAAAKLKGLRIERVTGSDDEERTHLEFKPFSTTTSQERTKP